MELGRKSKHSHFIPGYKPLTLLAPVGVNFHLILTSLGQSVPDFASAKILCQMQFAEILALAAGSCLSWPLCF